VPPVINEVIIDKKYYIEVYLMIEIVRTTVYERSIKKLLSESETEELEASVAGNPEQGVVIPNLKGIRKLRWGRAGQGKRGGLRVVYYCYRRNDVVYMLTAYTKSDREDLKPEEKKLLRRFVEELEDEK
jgi:hypothetical protein